MEPSYCIRVEGKGISLQALEGSCSSRRLRLLDLLDTRHYEDGKVVRLTHRPSLPPGSSWYSFLEHESTPGHMVPSEPRKKSPAKTLGIDPETLRLVAQCLNHYATPGPYCTKVVVHFHQTTRRHVPKIRIFLHTNRDRLKPQRDNMASRIKKRTG